MNTYEVTRTSLCKYTYFPAYGETPDSVECPCKTVKCERHEIPYVKDQINVYFNVYFTIEAQSLDDAIAMLRQEFEEGDRYKFVIMKSYMDGVEYNIEIYDDWRE